MNSASPMTVIRMIARRELVRYTRQPSRIIAAIGTPALIWLFLASGFAEAIEPQTIGQQSYSLYLLPGMMTLTVVFASIFASIALIDDRAGGWLQTVLVSPAPRWTIALGRSLGGTIVASAQAILLFAAVPFMGMDMAVAGVMLSAITIVITSFAVTALGLSFAWRCESTAGFHSVMNLVLMPMWLLSGAFFPLEGAAGWMRWLMLINPLTWCTEAIRAPLTGEYSMMLLLPPLGFAAAMLGAAVIVISTPSKRAAAA